MLQSRMAKINVVREYEPDLPTISAYGSELNQVWMVLIENAIEALAKVDRSRILSRKAACASSASWKRT
jgi:nitrogen-specific signal transduction histidine kinase